MSARTAERRDEYRYFVEMPTRWHDNDQLGHVNNVTYYRFFENIIASFTMDVLGIDWMHDPVIPLAVETSCRFWRPLSFPETVEVGLCVAHMGTTSIIYNIGLFSQGHETAAASGRFVHVFVDRDAQTPVDLPASARRICPKYT
jgi:acyl-CoA thioester hydrolase